MPAGSEGSGRSRCSSRLSQCTSVGASTGARQPCSAQALEYGVKHPVGVTGAVVTRPGATAYGDPVRTSSMPCSASARSTASSRRRP